MTHQKKEDPSECLTGVAVHLERSKEDERYEDRDESVDEVPGKRGQPVARHVHSTHKL